jgi:hypothetical protein
VPGRWVYGQCPGGLPGVIGGAALGAPAPVGGSQGSNPEAAFSTGNGLKLFFLTGGCGNIEGPRNSYEATAEECGGGTLPETQPEPQPLPPSASPSTGGFPPIGPGIIYRGGRKLVTPSSSRESSRNEDIDMDSESVIVWSFLDHLALINTRFIDGAIELRSRAGILDVTHLLECRKYEYNDYPIIEGLIEVLLPKDRAIAWILEVTRGEEHWQIGSSIVENGTEGQQVLKKFPDRTASSFHEFLAQLDETISGIMTIKKYLDPVAL